MSNRFTAVSIRSWTEPRRAWPPGTHVVTCASSRQGTFPCPASCGSSPALRSRSRTTAVTAPTLGLQPGDWVEVKSRREIEATLSPGGKYRGLWFDREMLPFCGKRYRVRQRVSRIIDYQTGRLIELKSDCLKLEGVTCSGDHSLGRWFCSRAIYPYWRECWLRRVDAGGTP